MDGYTIMTNEGVNKIEDYKKCTRGKEYPHNEKIVTKKGIILRHNKVCPHCTHKKRR